MRTAAIGDEGSSVHPVTVVQPLRWLARGLSDLRRHPGASLVYGFVVTAIGMLVLGFGTQPYFTYFAAAAVSGFFLIGPIIAACLCELSRLGDRQTDADFEASLAGLTRNRDGLINLALVLLAIALVWSALSSLMLFAFFGTAATSGAPEVMWRELTLGAGFAYLLVGGMLALLAFVLSVVAVPYLLDHPNATASQAMRASVQAVVANPVSMLVWAGMISALTLAGFATFMLGLIVIYPLLGHATWHAYRDLYPS